MLRKVKTIAILLVNMLALGLFLSFVTCEHATKFCPDDEGDGREFLGSSEGTIGDGSISTRQKLYRNADGNEITNLIVFYDGVNSLIGEAELTAAQDLVKQINLQMAGLSKKNAAADFPGEIFIDLGKFVLKIFVTLYPTDPTKYQVTLTNLTTGEFVSFLVARSSLTNGNSSQFVNLVATHAVLLCLGAQETVDDSQVCREHAPAYCDPLGVKRAYIEGSFSFAHGCQSSCKIICDVHDQGGLGF
ncbi:hypothetical protein JW998_02805 [candidate division KSB1 bacterium]|nr:hypothetical protein [candidate division KSB1 bacterium]